MGTTGTRTRQREGALHARAAADAVPARRRTSQVYAIGVALLSVLFAAVALGTALAWPPHGNAIWFVLFGVAALASGWSARTWFVRDTIWLVDGAVILFGVTYNAADIRYTHPMSHGTVIVARDGRWVTVPWDAVTVNDRLTQRRGAKSLSRLLRLWWYSPFTVAMFLAAAGSYLAVLSRQ